MCIFFVSCALKPKRAVCIFNYINMDLWTFIVNCLFSFLRNHSGTEMTRNALHFNVLLVWKIDFSFNISHEM
jgi:hypothetical protein